MVDGRYLRFEKASLLKLLMEEEFHAFTVPSVLSTKYKDYRWEILNHKAVMITSSQIIWEKQNRKPEKILTKIIGL